MRGAILMAGMAALGLAAGCNSDARENEGRTVRRDFQVGPFQSVSLGASHDVIVTVGGAPSVRAEGDAEMIERLDIRVENGDLRIGSRGRSWSLGGHRRSPVTVHVTVPSLAAATIGGSGDLRIDRVQGDRFVGSIGGSGDMNIGELRVGEAVFSVAGSGAMRAAGTAQRSQVELAGSGDIDLAALESRDAVVSLAGSGDVTARATGTARVSLFGSGDVTVTGPARCEVSKRGSGDVRCGGA